MLLDRNDAMVTAAKLVLTQLDTAHDFLAPITEEETADPAANLPFVQEPEEDDDEVLQQAGPLFKAGLQGHHQERFLEWAQHHSLPTTIFSHVIYIVMIMLFKGETTTASLTLTPRV